MASTFKDLLRRVEEGTRREIRSFFEKARDRARNGGCDTRIMESLARFVEDGGKRLRPALGYAAFLGIRDPDDEADLFRALSSLEILHAYLLVHDDIMDLAETRRGRPALHVELGSAAGSRRVGEFLAILAGDLGSALCLEPLVDSRFSADRRIRAVREILKCHQWVVLGQELDLRKQGPAERIMLHKTASYTTIGPVRTGAALAGADDRTLDLLEAYARPLGIAFQIRDDILSLFGDEKVVGKPVAADLLEGKLTLLVEGVKEAGSPSERDAVGKVLDQGLHDPEDIERALEAIRSSGALSRAEQRVGTLVQEARDALALVPLRDQGRQLLLEAMDLLAFRQT